jgi:hypothetical protein
LVSPSAVLDGTTPGDVNGAGNAHAVSATSWGLSTPRCRSCRMPTAPGRRYDHGMIDRPRNVISLGAVLALALSAAPATAGERDDEPVYVWQNGQGGGTAWGAMNDAYNASDSTQSMSCWVEGDRGKPTTAGCIALDASGTRLACHSDDPAIVQAAIAIDSQSYVYFVSDNAGSCTVLRTYRWSKSASRKA